MKADFTIAEIVELVISCKMSYGYVRENVSAFSEAIKAIECGYLYLNKCNDLYILTDEGHSFLHEQIKDISYSFITFMKRSNFRCPENDIYEWYAKEYGLDKQVSKEICKYIRKNLSLHGYYAEPVYQNQTWFYELKSADETTKKQLEIFKKAISAINHSIISDKILHNHLECTDQQAPRGFPNSITVDYTLRQSATHNAGMTIKIHEISPEGTFQKIEIVSIDAKPKRCGLGTHLFEQAQALAHALGVELIWGLILDNDAEQFYKAMACRIENGTFYFSII